MHLVTTLALSSGQRAHSCCRLPHRRSCDVIAMAVWAVQGWPMATLKTAVQFFFKLKKTRALGLIVKLYLNSIRLKVNNWDVELNLAVTNFHMGCRHRTRHCSLAPGTTPTGWRYMYKNPLLHLPRCRYRNRRSLLCQNLELRILTSLSTHRPDYLHKIC